MKREIKFRAWDKRDSKMYYSNKEVTVWAGGLEPSINTDGGKIVSDFELMQFTGLLDRNGKEIYEGDILTDDYNSIGVVKWNNDDASFIIEYRSEVQSFESPESWAIVKANLYENPELLNNR